MSIYFTTISKDDEPKDITSLGVEGLETHYINKNDFLSKYNNIIPVDLLKKLLSNLWAKNFGELSIYVLSSNSSNPNHDYDRMIYNLCNNLSTFKVGSLGSSIKLGNYGKYPYVVFYKDLNQMDPDFIAFNKNYVPQDVQNLT